MSRPSSRSSAVRGGWRARGRGASHRPVSPVLPDDRDIMDGLLTTPLQTIDVPAEGLSPAQVKDLQYLGSYNWVDSAQPTIIVPGSPPVWRDRPVPYTAPRDSGTRFVDQNACRLPSSALLPIFCAADVVAEDAGALDVDWSVVDFVTDRNNLRKLLSWVNGVASDFRIDMQLAGRQTLLLDRWETRASKGFTGWTYGSTFAHESTTPAEGCEKCTGHYRIVKYDLDGLMMVVRSEVNARLPPSSAPTRKTAPASADADEVSQLMSGLDITSSPAAARSSTELKVIRAGAEVPQSALVEYNTRAARYIDQFDVNEMYLSLYLSQAANHFLAAHDRGRFETVVKRTLADPELEALGRDAQPGFRKLRRALQEIQELVVRHGQRGRLTLVYQNGAVQVFERSSQASFVPDSVLERFGV